MQIKKKVIFCVGGVILGGMEKILLEITKNLSACGKYEIFIASKQKITENYFLDIFQKYNIKIIENFYIKDKPVNFINKHIWRLGKIFKKIKNFFTRPLNEYDLVIDFHSGVWMEEFKVVSKPKILWVHAGLSHFDNYLLKKAKKFRFDFNSYSAVILLTKQLTKQIRELALIGSDKICNIYNPFNIEMIRQKGIHSHRPTTHKYFLIVSRLDEGKDIETVINAYSLFQKQYFADVKLYIIGEGPLMDRLKNNVKLLNQEENIIFKGKISEPYAFIKHAESTILSSLSEGLPTILIESMILKTLTIASNCPSGPSEILLNGEAGILFEVGNVNELTNIFIDIHHNKIDKKVMIDNATHSLFRFDYKSIMPQIENLLDKIFTQNKI